jgi:hypothetical protein
MGRAMTPATSAITSALLVQQQGVASAINDLSREVGGALGIAVIGSIMTAVYRSRLTAPGVPADVLNKAKDSMAVAAHIGGPVAASADTAFVDGVHIALYTAAGTAALAAVVVFLVLSRHGSQPDQAGAGHDTDHAVTPTSRCLPDLTFITSFGPVGSVSLTALMAVERCRLVPHQIRFAQVARSVEAYDLVYVE